MVQLRLAFVWIAMLAVTLGCSTSNNTVQKQLVEEPTPTPPVQQEKVAPLHEIRVFINERVEYIFVKEEGNWEGIVKQYSTNNPDTRQLVRTMAIEPTQGWEDFEFILEALDIYDMEDQSKIESRKSGPVTNISRSYRVKITKDGKTHTYHYFNPEAEMIDHWQSQQVATFGTYLATEIKVIEEGS